MKHQARNESSGRARLRGRCTCLVAAAGLASVLAGCAKSGDAGGGKAPGPQAATKENPFVNSLGMRFVPVAITGGTASGKRVLFSVWETRRRDFGRFVKQSGYNYDAGDAPYDLKIVDGRAEVTRGGSWREPGFEQGEDHPVVNVSWVDAKAFCKWLTDKERGAGLIGKDMAYRLPTDEEWSVAVGLPEEQGRTPEEKDGKIKDVFPWGTQWPPPDGAGNYADSALGRAFSGLKGIVIEGYDDGFEASSTLMATRWPTSLSSSSATTATIRPPTTTRRISLGPRTRILTG